MENRLCLPDTKRFQSNKAEKLSTNISPFNFIKNLQKNGSTSIKNFIEPRKVYNKYQFAYCKNISTATILSKLYNDVKQVIKRCEPTIAVFTDYSKAFDTTNFFYTLIQKNAFVKFFQKPFILGF